MHQSSTVLNFSMVKTNLLKMQSPQEALQTDNSFHETTLGNTIKQTPAETPSMTAVTGAVFGRKKESVPYPIKTGMIGSENEYLNSSLNRTSQTGTPYMKKLANLTRSSQLNKDSKLEESPGVRSKQSLSPTRKDVHNKFAAGNKQLKSPLQDTSSTTPKRLSPKQTQFLKEQL